MNRNLRLQALAAATSLMLAGAATAANRVDLRSQDVGKLKQQYRTAVAQTGTPAMAHARHAQLINLDAESHLVMKTRHSDLGVRNTRYQQTFRGIPVFGEHVVVSEDDSGQVRALFGRKVAGLEREIASVTPKLSKAQAIAIGKRAALDGRTVVHHEQAYLTIYLDKNGRAHLTYLVAFSADVPQGNKPTLPNLIVDANNGRVLEQWENLQTANGTGPGGNAKTGQYEYGTDFGYLNVAQSGTTCTMDNANVRTINLNHSADVDLTNNAAHSYNCPRNTVKAINGAYSPLNDAHYFGGVVFNMYDDYMAAAPLPGKLLLGVHSGNNWENAAWNSLTRSMRFGDGANELYPLVSLDVMAHEVSHGYTQYNSNLTYNDFAPGALNEAFSDMAGEAAEYYMHGSNDFMMGATILKGEGAMRYMETPSDDGVSLDHVDEMPAGGIDNHRSSGFYNRAFYNLAHMAGWNTKTAFQAFARANRDYWTASTTFNEGGAGVLRAACDMDMDGQDVIDAFDTVGIDAGTLPADCGGAPANTAPVANFTSSVSGLKVTFTDSSTDSDGIIGSRSWTFGDGTSSTATNPSKTYTAGGTYSVKLSVTDNDGATHSITKSVTVTAPPTSTALTNGVAKTSLSTGTGASLNYTMVVPAGASNLKFVTSGGTGDADLYVKFGSAPTDTSYDCRPYENGNAETCAIANAQAGTYFVRVKAFAGFSGLSLTGSYTAGSSAQTYSNATDYSIPDNNPTGVSSSIAVSGRSGNAPASATLSVNIVHPYVADLKLDLIAPDGTVYNLRSNSGGSADNIVESYTKNLSAEALNGTWKLRVIDSGNQDVGMIDSWSIRF